MGGYDVNWIPEAHIGFESVVALYVKPPNLLDCLLHSGQNVKLSSFDINLDKVG